MRPVVTILGLCVLTAPLANCGVMAKVEARGDYQQTERAYKDCLLRNPATPQNCEGMRLAMEADERKYNAMSAGMTPGAHSNGTLTILSR